jgi:hypothetical protein
VDNDGEEVVTQVGFALEEALYVASLGKEDLKANGSLFVISEQVESHHIMMFTRDFEWGLTLVITLFIIRILIFTEPLCSMW